MRKAGGKIFVGILLLLIALIFYTSWDNNRVKVVKQDIIIEDLPEKLDGYKILQITDLHEKVFGSNQKDLISKINSIDYDAIVFTGDMLVSDDSSNYKPYYDIIDGIKKKEHALFVSGNSDPSNYVYDNAGNVGKHDFIKGMESRGVMLLESVYSIQIDAAKIHFVDFELSTLNTKMRDGLPNIIGKSLRNIDYRNKLLDEITKLDNVDNSDILIGLNHYPVVDAKIDQLNNHEYHVFRDYDLIMAGHYHGGQIRLPFYGALFVPEPYYERSGLFPPLNRVKGLWEYKQTKQYVSAGLGSSQTVSFLKFRLFNTPEINVLTFKKKG
ncbi:metallophosphoesterase [Metabacillus elymi]|uniref:Metallophosphoesterase n=1 Tax=Metabacillus elymi TaxID=2745198 RepID=A0ABX6S053_9BACI|nr:metallophosphoesterase [Metabacillus sp. KUDC1714]QNF26176.1 metallophosphoesterase [Metabacillus sp. KUDC1714]